MPEEDKLLIRQLASLGLNGVEIAAITGWGRTTVYKIIPKKGRPWHRWTEAELQLVVDAYERGWTVTRVARRIGVSPRACYVAMWRHRGRIRSDPLKREVLHWLKLAMVDAGAKPGKAITAIRRANLFGRDSDDLQLRHAR